MSEDMNAIADKLKELLGSTNLESLLKPAEKITEPTKNQPDMETLIKFKQAFDTVNSKPDPRANLLASLKPYMNEKRSSELDRISGLLNLTKITEIVKAFKGGL